MAKSKNLTARLESKEAALRAQREAQAAADTTTDAAIDTTPADTESEIVATETPVDTTPAEIAVPTVETSTEETPAETPATPEESPEETAGEPAGETPNENVDTVTPAYVPEKGEIIHSADGKGLHSVVKVSGIYFAAECGRAYRIGEPAKPEDLTDLCAYCADGSIAPPDADEPTSTPRRGRPARPVQPWYITAAGARLTAAKAEADAVVHAANLARYMSMNLGPRVFSALDVFKAGDMSRAADLFSTLANDIRLGLKGYSVLVPGLKLNGATRAPVRTPRTTGSTAPATTPVSDGERLVCAGSKVAPASVYTAPNGAQGGVCSVCARRTGVNKEGTLMSNHAPNATWLKAQQPASATAETTTEPETTGDSTATETVSEPAQTEDSNVSESTGTEEAVA